MTGTLSKEAARALMNPRDRQSLEAIEAPGTEVYVYGYCRRGTTVRTEIPVIELLFGESLGRRLESTCAIVRWEDGTESDLIHPSIMAPLSAAEEGWHIFDAAGQIVAGGPNISETRAHEIVAEFFPSHVVRQGVSFSPLTNGAD